MGRTVAILGAQVRRSDTRTFGWGPLGAGSFSTAFSARGNEYLDHPACALSVNK